MRNDAGGFARAESLNALGAAAFAARDWDAAQDAFAGALSVDPDHLAARMNLARVLEVQGRLREAGAEYERVLASDAANVPALLRLGIVRAGEGRLAEAVVALASARGLAPNDRLAALNFGIVCNFLGRYAEAREALEALLQRWPDDAEALRALADTLYHLHLPDATEAAARRALAIGPEDPQTHVLLGLVAEDRGAFAEAERIFREIVRRHPESAEAEMNLGVLAQRLNRVEEALVHGERAVALEPENALAHVNLGMSRLFAGDLRGGWAELEWRMRGPRGRDLFPYLDLLPLWRGEALAGRELLIAREQGLGDFVFHSRFFSAARARGARVVVEMPPEFGRLYQGFEGIDEAILERADRSRLDRFAAHVPLCSLPFVLGIERPTIPSRAGYFEADPSRVAEFRARFAALGARRVVGLVWAGSPEHLLDRYRSVSLSQFEPLAGIEGVRFVSLQKGAGEQQVQGAPPDLGLVHLGGELRDFDDTAAALAALDLLISVDTAVAHLAAALGRPVWLLHGFGNYWLWGMRRSDSPWYPTLRIFHQHEPNRWPAVFGDVRAALERWSEGEAKGGF